MLGGQDIDSDVQVSTQIVRPNQPTVWGPHMIEAICGHCSATLADNSVMVTGGFRRRDPGGSARTEIFKNQQWTRREHMNQRRVDHSCSTVWIERNPVTAAELGIIAPRVTNSSVLSVVVAGGEAL